ncbi:MAG: hypothetical protein HRT35_20400 [Algicola sp.]|nr:hypothetical protein [Algicola sp.]
MRLNKVLTISGVVFECATDAVQLFIHSPGKAQFLIQSDTPVTGLATFDLGYSNLNLQRYFNGFVESSTAVNAHQQMVHCREWTALLNMPCPLSVRHCTIPDVLAAITAKTTLNFVVPEADYTRVKQPCFYSAANGLYALDHIGKTYQINQCMWQQNGDGSVYLGSWDDSFWAAKPINIDPRHFAKIQAGELKITAIPAVRPGCLINNRYVSSVQFSDTTMVISCSTQLNAAF